MKTAYSERKKCLLDTAVALYKKKGDFTMRELTSAAGVNLASVKYYFGDKETLRHGVEKELVGEIMDIAAAVEREQLQPFERLNQLMTSFLLYFSECPGVVKYFYSAISSINTRGQELLSIIAGKDNPIVTIFARAVREAAGISDPNELYTRYLMFISALAPPFVYLLLGTDGRSRLSERAGFAEHQEEDDEKFFEKYAASVVRLITTPDE